MKTVAYQFKNITDLKEYDGTIIKGDINFDTVPHPRSIYACMWLFVASVAAFGFVELIFDILFVGLLHPPDLLACGLVAALPRRRLAVPRAVSPPSFTGYRRLTILLY